MKGCRAVRQRSPTTLTSPGGTSLPSRRDGGGGSWKQLSLPPTCGLVHQDSRVNDAAEAREHVLHILLCHGPREAADIQVGIFDHFRAGPRVGHLCDKAAFGGLGNPKASGTASHFPRSPGTRGHHWEPSRQEPPITLMVLDWSRRPLSVLMARSASLAVT